MNLLRICQCLGDATRLRALNLLIGTPLCVCHLQELLGASQVKVSRHLAYLKKRGIVESVRHRNWMIHRLPSERSPELEAMLRCLRDCRKTEPVLIRDIARLEKLLASGKVRNLVAEGCCEPKPSAKTGKKAAPCC